MRLRTWTSHFPCIGSAAACVGAWAASCTWAPPHTLACKAKVAPPVWCQQRDQGGGMHMLFSRLDPSIGVHMGKGCRQVGCGVTGLAWRGKRGGTRRSMRWSVLIIVGRACVLRERSKHPGRTPQVRPKQRSLRQGGRRSSACGVASGAWRCRHRSKRQHGGQREARLASIA
jgi:hypothetical protein